MDLLSKILLPVICFISMALSPADACTKPVFRYALELWPAEPYTFTVLHDGSIDQTLRSRIEALAPLGFYSFRLTHYNVYEELPSGVIQKSWEADPSPSRLPIGVIQKPYGDEEIWIGKVDETGARELKDLIYPDIIVDVIRDIKNGDVASWVLIPGDEEAENQRVRTLLKTRLKNLESELKLPHELDPTNPEYSKAPLPGVPFHIKFSIRETELDKPENALLKKNLEMWRPKMMKRKGPKVMPVFGRGRALEIFHGTEITAKLLKDVSSFLVGECSCKVKELNPGFDLMMPFAWDRILVDMQFDHTPLFQSLNSSKPMPFSAATSEPKHP